MNALLECIKPVEQSGEWCDAVDSNFTLSVYLKPIYREWCRHQCNCMQCDATLLQFYNNFLDLYTFCVCLSKRMLFFVLCHSKFIHIHNRTQPHTDTHTCIHKTKNYNIYFINRILCCTSTCCILFIWNTQQTLVLFHCQHVASGTLTFKATMFIYIV